MRWMLAARDRYRGSARASPLAGLRHGRPPFCQRDPEDIGEMRRLTIEAEASAFGFTTSRTDSQDAGRRDGAVGPCADESCWASVLRSAVGAGAFGMNSDFDDEAAELAWLTQLARETGRPVWFLLTDRYDDPARWRRLLTGAHAARADGAPLTAQIAGRPIGVMMGIGTALNPFSLRPSYREVDGLSIAEQRRRLAAPGLRRRILAEKPSAEEVSRLAQFRQLLTTRWDRF
jgi:N-acyl-D-aspartate/D-glutamate deacylase